MLISLKQHSVVRHVTPLKHILNPRQPVRVIRSRKSKKDRQHNGQKKKDKRTNYDLQNMHIKLKTTDSIVYIIELGAPSPLKTGVELRCSGRVAVPAPRVAPIVLLLFQTR